MRIVGVDALVVAAVAPALMPVPAARADRFAVFAPATVFLNPAARQLLGVDSATDDQRLQLQSGLQMRDGAGRRHGAAPAARRWR